MFNHIFEGAFPKKIEHFSYKSKMSWSKINLYFKLLFQGGYSPQLRLKLQFYINKIAM